MVVIVEKGDDRMRETNEALVLKYQAGEATFEDVYLQCKAMIHKEAGRWRIKGLDYDDKVSILMEAFLEACQRYDGREGVKFSTYCITHLRYVIRDHWRRATQLSSSKYQVLSIEAEMNLKDQATYEAGLINVAEDAVSAFVAKEIEQIVRESLPSIQEPARSFVRHYLFEDMTKSEIAKAYNRNNQNVQYHINKALKVIQGELARKGYFKHT